MGSKQANQGSDAASNATIEAAQSENETPMGELEKVRSILFGEQIRAYEAHLSRVEQELQAQISAIGKDLNKRIDGLDDRLKGRFDEMLELLAKESHTREHQAETLTGELERMSKIIDEHRDVQDEKLASLEQSINASFEKGTGELKAGLETQVQSMFEELRKALSSVDQAKVDRTRFAQFLTSLAAEMNGE